VERDPPERFAGVADQQQRRIVVTDRSDEEAQRVEAAA